MGYILKIDHDKYMLHLINTENWEKRVINHRFKYERAFKPWSHQQVCASTCTLRVIFRHKQGNTCMLPACNFIMFQFLQHLGWTKHPENFAEKSTNLACSLCQIRMYRFGTELLPIDIQVYP